MLCFVIEAHLAGTGLLTFAWTFLAFSPALSTPEKRFNLPDWQGSRKIQWWMQAQTGQAGRFRNNHQALLCKEKGDVIFQHHLSNTKALEVCRHLVLKENLKKQKPHSLRFGVPNSACASLTWYSLTVSVFQWRAGGLVCATPHCSAAGHLGDSSPEIQCLYMFKRSHTEAFNILDSRMEAKLIFKRKEDLNNYSSELLTETTVQNCWAFTQLPHNMLQPSLLKISPKEQKEFNHSS